MQPLRAPMSCPQCTRRILDAALGTNVAAQALRSTSIRVRQHQAVLWRRKQFSTSTSREKGRTVASQWKPGRPAQPSMNVMLRQQQEEARRNGQDVLGDRSMGVLPGTFIFPSDPKMRSSPSVWYQYAKSRVMDTVL